MSNQGGMERVSGYSYEEMEALLMQALETNARLVVRVACLERENRWS